MPLGVNPKQFKLKTRFPLHEMIVNDDDFRVRLEEKENDRKNIAQQMVSNKQRQTELS